MLASGAHVKIGTKEFHLAFDNDGAYSYSLTPTGDQVQFWLLDDWSGGEGNDAHDNADPTVYDQGNVNPRIPGSLTTPPTRTTFSSGNLSPVPDRAYAVPAAGRLYVIGEKITNDANSLWYTTNMTSFTELALNAWSTANIADRVTAVCTDGVDLYLAGYDDNLKGSQIIKVEGLSGTDSIVATTAATTGGQPIIGMGVSGDYLYYFSGAKIWYRKLSSGVGTAPEKVALNLGRALVGQTYGTDFWGGAVTGDQSIYYLLSTEGATTVYETTTEGATYRMWTLPDGFTGKAITYQAGAVVVVGEYLNNAAAYGMSTVSRQPAFLGFVRLGTAISLEVAGSGFGTEVIMAEKDVGSGGKVFIYDIGYDAFSELDEFTHVSGEIWSAGVFQDKRYVAVEDGNDLNLYCWETDDTPSTTVNGRMESGVWDMDLPEDEKQLDGIHVLSDANSTKTVQVYYQDNEDGTWTSAGTATTGFHNYLAVSDASSTVKFRTLRIRVDPKAGAKVFGVSVRWRVNTYEETWEMLLDLTDEEVDQSSGSRRRTNQDRGWQLRDYIRDISDDKAVVTFLDGAKYPQGDGDDPDKYSTHTVIADIPVDRLTKPGEGTMLVRLRSVSTN